MFNTHARTMSFRRPTRQEMLDEAVRRMLSTYPALRDVERPILLNTCVRLGWAPALMVRTEFRKIAAEWS